MSIRPATYRDIDEVSRILTTAFWNEDCIGRFIHPYREDHPACVFRFWRRKIRSAYWNYRTYILVSVDEAGRVTGVAEWARIGDANSIGRKSGLALDLPWWDPRRFIAPLVGVWNGVERWIWPNRAAVPDRLDAYRRAIPFFTRHLVGNRASGWTLNTLGVRPNEKGKGYGKNLVRMGLRIAQNEGVPASVVTADGTEEFYRKCGFEEEVGKITEGDNNPVGEVKGGVIFFKDPQ